MLKQFVYDILTNYSYLTVYLLTVLYFIFLYVGLAPVFKKVSEYLYSKGLVMKISESFDPNKNISVEIKNSIRSIFIFGLSGVAIVFMIRNGIGTLLPDNTIVNVLLGLVILTLWNELYFYVAHRLLHIPFLYRSVHYVHHRSKVPTVYAIYSFHWFEALVLSVVPVLAVPFISFSTLALFLYPLSSVLINYAGHCNYRFGNGSGLGWKLFATRHSRHHYKNNGDYGFSLGIFDKLSSYFKQKNINE